MLSNFDSLFPDLDSFDPHSKVWVYFSDRKFSNEESVEIQASINQFCHQWKSHGAEVSARGYLIFNRIIFLIADETQAGVSGCSTDASVRYIKSIEKDYLTNLMNRDYLYFLSEEDSVEKIPLKNIQELDMESTLVFNPFFKNIEELRELWLLPLLKSKYKNLL